MRALTARIVGTNGYEETKDSDVVVITAGIALKARDEPGRPAQDQLRDRLRCRPASA